LFTLIRLRSCELPPSITTTTTRIAKRSHSNNNSITDINNANNKSQTNSTNNESTVLNVCQNQNTNLNLDHYLIHSSQQKHNDIHAAFINEEASIRLVFLCFFLTL